MKGKMNELNKKTISTLIISILMLSMALSVIPMASADPGLTIHLDAVPEFETWGTQATAAWAPTPDTVALTYGAYNAKLALVSATGVDDYAYVRVYPGPTGITVNNLLTGTPNKIPTFKYWLLTGTTVHPDLELRFTSGDYDGINAGFVDITVYQASWATTAGVWNLAGGVTGANLAVYYGFSPDGTEWDRDEGGTTLATVIDYIQDLGYGDWKLSRVSPQFGDVTGSHTAYIDNFVIAGVTYNLEPSVKVGAKVKVSGTSDTLGGLVKVYWDSVKDWDGTTGYRAETYAVGTSYSVEITIPAAIAGNHYVIVKDIEASATASRAITVGPKIALSPTAGIAGDTITVTGTGFTKDSDVTMTYENATDTNPLTLSPLTPKTSSLGSFTATFAIPEDAAASCAISVDAPNVATATLAVGTVITLTPSKGIAGTMVTVSGRGFTASSTVDITWTVTTGYDLLLVNDYPTNSYGAFTTTFTVPPVTTGIDYTITATDASSDHKHDSATFTVTGVTAITLTPKSGLSGTTVTVTGEWFTAGKTVTVYFDGVSVGTTPAGAGAPYSIDKDITIPVAATFGAHIIKAMDSEGVYATKTFTVAERITTIETRSDSYDPGDTISFNIYSTVAFNPNTIAIEIYDPDGYLFWNVDWVPEETALDSGIWVVPYSAQIAGTFHLTLPSDATLGIWEYTATYSLEGVSGVQEVTGTFTVGVPVGPQPELPAETTNQKAKDSTGAPKTSFVLGETVLASAEVANAGTVSQAMLIVVQWKDPDLRVMAPVFISVTLAPGQSFEYAPGLMLPLTGYTKGTWTATIMVFSAWPAQGGVTIGAPVTITITVS